MMISLHGLGSTAPAHFTDVPEGHTFYPYVQGLYEAGITSGCQTDPPKFCPDETVTRGQLAVFLSRAIDAKSPASFSIGGFSVTPMMALGGALILIALLRR